LCSNKQEIPKIIFFCRRAFASLREAAGQKHREQRAHDEKRSQRASSAVFASETLSRRRRSPRDFVSHRRHHFFNLSLKNRRFEYKTKGLPSPSSVFKRSLCAKEDLTDNEHTRGREKDAKVFSFSRKNIYRERERQNESVDDALVAVRALLAINSFQRCRPTFWFFASGDFFSQTLNAIMNASFYNS
jgi:hypothetical protein